MQIDLSKYASSEKIYEICQQLDNEGTKYVLHCYYYDRSDMISCGKVPFLFQDGKFVWNIDFMSVTKGDILRTFPEYYNENSMIDLDSYSCQGGDVDYEIKLTKQEFWNQWKQKAQEWKTLNISLLDKRRFKKFIQKSPVSPMSVTQAVYTMSEYLIGDFSCKFSCTEKEAISILKCLGFKTISDGREYSINGDFNKDVKIVCDNVNDMIAPYMRQGHVNVIKRFFSSMFKWLSNFFGEQRDKIATDIDITAVRLKPVKREQRGKFRVAISIVITAGSVVVVFFILYFFFRISATSSLSQGDALTGSIMGFGGALFGALITGIITIITTACLISQSYKVDYHNERLRVLPVFSVKCFGKGDFKKFKGNYKNTHHMDLELYNWDGEDPRMYVVCTNIGNGMAFQSEIHVTPSNPDFTEVDTIPVGDSVAWRHVKMTLLRPYISYKDIYGNLYSQRFEINISEDGKNIRVVEQTPELILRTERARYIQ